MPTHFIKMNQNVYPFGQSEEYDPKNRLLIKHTLFKEHIHVNEILRMASIAKKVSQNKIFIKLETILEEEHTINFLYQYVPIKVQKYIRTMDQKFIKQYRNQLYAMAQILSENRIITNIQMANMGLNQNYETKYFLGLNFVQKKQVNIYELKNDYLEEIKRIFITFISSQSALVPKKNIKNMVKLDNRLSDTQQIENFSTYMDPRQGIVKTRKHESIYYERTKDQQIKKRKQSYMSSVSNLRLNNLYRRINQIQLQVCNTKTANKNGFKLSIQGRQFTSKSSYQNAKQAIQTHRFRGISNNRNMNSPTANNNCIKYPGCENDYEYTDQFSQLEQYEKSIRSNKPSRYAIKNKMEMSAHENNKRSYKKFSTQFPTLSDFQQPLMNLTSALRISANGLDKKQKKVNKKIQMFKERQYSEMKSVSGNTNYIRDFMSVLEQDSSTNQRTSKHNDNDNSDNQIKAPAIMMQSHKQLQEFQYVSPRNPEVSAKKHSMVGYSYNKTPQSPTYDMIQNYQFLSQASLPSQKNILHDVGKSLQEFPGPSMPSMPYSKVSKHSNSNAQHKNAFTLDYAQINAKQATYGAKQALYNEGIKLRTKGSVQQQSNIQNRVKDAISNSKKLILKLKQKAKHN